MKAPFQQNAAMTAVAVAYRNGALIADTVCPRVPTDGQKFAYMKFAQGDFLTYPETKVGRKGKPNEVEFGSEEVPASTVDHGLDAPVPQQDMDNWQAARNNGNTALPDPRLRATTGVTELLALAREVRVANLYFNAGSYGAANKQTLAGVDQWSDFVNSDPDYDIKDALDTMVMRPNHSILGRRVWSTLSRHPKLVKAILGASNERGTITKQEFSEHFELEGLHIGEAFVNVAKKGQAVSTQRAWGNHAAFVHMNMNADTQFGITFGYTAQWGSRIAGTIHDPDMGLRGGERARVGESVLELVTANDLGYFFQNAAA